MTGPLDMWSRRTHSFLLRGRHTRFPSIVHRFVEASYTKRGRGGVGRHKVDLGPEVPDRVELGEVVDQLLLDPYAEVVDPVLVQVVEVQEPDERA